MYVDPKKNLGLKPKVSYWTVVSRVSISNISAQHILTKDIGPVSFKKDKTEALNPPNIEKSVNSGKELTAIFKLGTLDGVF